VIVTSMLLVIVGAVTLVIGIFTDELNLVYISIGSCLLAGLFLIVGIVRGRPSRKPVLTGAGEQASWSGAGTSWPPADDQTLEREPEPARSSAVQVMDEPRAADEPFQPPADDDEIVVVPKRTAGSRSVKKAAKKAAKTAGKKAAKKAVGKKAGNKAASRTADARRAEAALVEVAGLGPAKRKALLDHFGSYDALRKATPRKITEVPGISDTLAQRVKRALR
jgi:hypothetical protein